MVNGGGWCRPGSDLILHGSSLDGVNTPGALRINCTNGFDIAASGFPHPQFGSDGTSEVYAFHTAGAIVLMGDASVRLVSQKVSILTFAALITRSGGEILGNDW